MAHGRRPIWKITSPEWRLNLTPRDAASPETPIEVFLAEYQAAVVDGGRWLHEAAYSLRHEANTDLNLTLPADAEVLSVSIDGVEAAPLQAAPRRLWMPLTGRPAVCRVRVRWKYAAEELDRPNLDAPTLQGAREDKAVWTVLVPPGWGPDDSSRKNGLQSGLAQAAALSWQRAEAQFRISPCWPRGRPKGPGRPPLRKRSGNSMPSVGGQSKRSEVAPPRRIPLGRAAGVRLELLQDLLEKNKVLAETRHFEAIRAKAERQAEEGEPERTNAWEGQGRPLYAHRDGGESAPSLTLTRTEWSNARKLGPLLGYGCYSSSWWGLLSLSRHDGDAGFFWPEQIALAGLVGWWAAARRGS